MRLPQNLLAVVFDIGGTLVVEASPGTPVADLEVRCLAGVVTDLTDLSKHVRLAAATNTAVMTEHDVRMLLAPTGLDELLEVLVTSADVGADKPDPTVLHEVLARLGIDDPSRALYVGNLDTDETAARAAGMPYAAVHPDGIRAAIDAWAARLDHGPELGRDRTWNRPVPLIGDTTSAAERAADPGAWRLSAADRAGLYAAISTRRDIRRYRPDPIDHEVVQRVLGAAHAAPSVGHSQPWRFVLVDDSQIREQAAHIADRERLLQADVLGPDAARHLLDLQLEGIREAPLGIVVCCDRRTPAAGVLGRRTFPDADLWSCACAIENLWLAARAEGLGVGWVTLFPPDELVALCHLPDGVETLGWLCIGWPDERPPAPGLERAGWSKRTSLDEVIIRNRWPHEDDEPKPPISRLHAPDQHAVVTARDAADPILSPPGSLGVLDRAIDRIAALGGASISTGTLVLVGGRHPVASLGVSAFSARVTDDVLDAARCERSLGAVAARSAGLATVAIDAGTSHGNLRDADPMTHDVVAELVEHGISAGHDAAQVGLVVLGEVGIGNTTVAAALACVLLGLNPDEAVGLGAGSDTAMVATKVAVVTMAIERARKTYGPDLLDPLTLLSALGGPEFATLAGVVIGASRAGAPVILDGLATSLAALVASLIEPGVASHLIGGQRSRERAHALVLTQLGLEPLLDLRLRSGEGVGACLASGMLLQALQMRRDVARTAPDR